MVDGLGVSKPFFSAPLVFFYIFQIGQNTGYIWNIMFTSDRCRRNLAAVTSVNYGCDFRNLTCTYKTTATSPKGQWLQIFWYSVMAKQMTKLVKLTFHKFHQKGSINMDKEHVIGYQYLSVCCSQLFTLCMCNSIIKYWKTFANMCVCWLLRCLINAPFPRVLHWTCKLLTPCKLPVPTLMLDKYVFFVWYGSLY